MISCGLRNHQLIFVESFGKPKYDMRNEAKKVTFFAEHAQGWQQTIFVCPPPGS